MAIDSVSIVMKGKNKLKWAGLASLVTFSFLVMPVASQTNPPQADPAPERWTGFLLLLGFGTANLIAPPNDFIENAGTIALTFEVGPDNIFGQTSRNKWLPGFSGQIFHSHFAGGEREDFHYTSYYAGPTWRLLGPSQHNLTFSFLPLGYTWYHDGNQNDNANEYNPSGTSSLRYFYTPATIRIIPFVEIGVTYLADNKNPTTAAFLNIGGGVSF